jgi:hypothetical protein
MAKKSHKPKSSNPSQAGQPRRSLDEVQAIKTALWGAPAVPPPAPPPAAAKVVLASHEARVAAAAATGPILVAKGDSWFDYAPGMDILDNLKYYYHYSIIKLSTAGDTLENMVFGTALGHDNVRLASQLDTLVQCVATYQPKAVLFSGGGNDIAGEPLEAYLNHKDSGILPLLRAGYMNDVLGGLFQSAYQKLAERIWAVRPETHIVTHGYGHPIPDGRAVFNFPFGFHFIGPWLKPAFCKKDILDQAAAQGIIAQLIDAFNAMLAALQHLYSTNAQGRFHYIDLRQEIKPADWVNELHLSDEAFRRVAAKFDAVLQTF